jgi:excisionase family DNA binding protein
MAITSRAKAADAEKPVRKRGSSVRHKRRRQTTKREKAPSAAEVTSAVQSVLQLVPASVQAGFVDAVTVNSTADLDESLWGAAPAPAKQRAAALQALEDDFVARRAVLDNSLTRAEVANLLGVSNQAVLERLETGDLIGLKKGREWRIPMWQINPDAERGFLPGLAQLRRVFPGGLVSLTRWATTPNVELGDKTPADVLASGHVDDVIRVAATITAAAW